MFSRKAADWLGMRPLSLKARMSFTVVTLVLVILAGAGGLALHYFEQSLRQLIFDQQSTLVGHVAERIDDQIRNTSALIAATAARFPLDRLKSADLAQDYLDTQLGLGTVSLFDNGIFLFTAEGLLLAEYPFKPDRRGRDYSFRSYFQTTIQSGQPQISDPYVSSQSHQHPAINFTAPIVDQEGRVAAVIAGSVDLTRKNFLGGLSDVRIGDTGYFYLYNTDRLMIMHRDPQRIMKRDVPVGANIWLDRAIEGFEGTEETVNSRGLHTLVTFKRLNNGRWILAANYPTAEAFQPIAEARRLFLLGIVAILLISIGIIWMVTRAFLSPLIKLNHHVTSFFRGGEKIGCDKPKSVEIGTLAATFDALMADVEEQREFTSNLLQNSAVPCFVIDKDHKVLIWTQALEKLTGIKATETRGTNQHWRAFYPAERPCLADIVLDKDFDAAIDLYPQLADSPLIQDGMQAEGWLTLQNGKSRYLTFDAAPIRNKGDKVVAVIETLHDLSNLKWAEKALQETQESYHALVDSSPDAILVHRQGSILFGNRAAVRLFRAEETRDLTGRTIFELLHPDFHDVARQHLTEVEERKNEQSYVEEKIICFDGQELDVEVGTSSTYYAGGWAAQTVLRDITYRKAEQEKIWRQANFDNLTGLPNRSLFMDRLEHAISRCDREGNPVGLMFIDLDHFKAINDTLGHDNGDELLRQAAQRINCCLRKTDTAARLGGDEFTVILPSMNNEKALVTVADRLIAALAEPFQLPGGVGNISGSIGGAVYPRDSSSIADLLSVADLSMYQAKQAGRNRHFIPGQG